MSKYVGGLLQQHAVSVEGESSVEGSSTDGASSPRSELKGRSYGLAHALAMARAVFALTSLMLVACTSPAAVPEASSMPLMEPSPAPPFPQPLAYELPETAIRIDLSFPQAEQRRIDVDLVIPTGGRSSLTLMMPAWAPGSYLIREFSKNVIAPAAYSPGGEKLALRKVAKNRMRVVTGGARYIHLRYQVYAGDLSVRTSFVGWEYAVINPSSVVFTDVEAQHTPHVVVLALPDRWPDVFTALAPIQPEPNEGEAAISDGKRVFVAKHFGELVDAPLLIGRAYAHAFTVRGVPHYMAHVGDLNGFPRQRAQKDVQAIVTAHADFWQHIPYEKFHFLSVLAPASGGLEHRDSTVIMTDPHLMRGLVGWQNWLRLVSHELFHAWNGKRLRPQAMGLFDFEHEVYTQSLWFVEGITAYYDNLLLRRAGLMSPERYLSIISRMAQQLSQQAGEEVQSLADSSFDAWIKWYRPDAETPNTTVSYYVKGALLGWVIDAMIREETQGKKSLDDVMRYAYRHFATDTGYTDEELYDAFKAIGGAKVASFAEQAVRQRMRLTYEVPLRVFGLRQKKAPPRVPMDVLDQRVARGHDVYLGIETQLTDHRVMVTTVSAHGPAWAAGIAPDDELVAIDGYRVPSSGVETLLRRYAPKEMVEVWVARRGRMVRLEAELDAKPAAIEFEVDPQASLKASGYRSSWLEGR